MDRLAELLKYIGRGKKGVEIGPYFNPLVPKAAGWDVLILDVFDTATLRERAKSDPNVPDARITEIEPVDLVGPAHHMATLAEAQGVAPGSVDFILSSHNFEHLPDPVRFLQAAARLLRPGGVLSMAIPDCRTCFDAVRPPSTAGAMIEAFFEARERPSARQEYEFASLFANCRRGDGSNHPHFIDAGEDAAPILTMALPPLMQRWKARLDGSAADYQDTHCWTLTPAVFFAIVTELRVLGLCDLELQEVSPNNGIEFYAHLRRPIADAALADAPLADAARVAAYTAQLHEFRLGIAPRISPAPVPPTPAAMGRKAMVKALIGGIPVVGPAARTAWRLVRPR